MLIWVMFWFLLPEMHPNYTTQGLLPLFVYDSQKQGLFHSPLVPQVLRNCTHNSSHKKDFLNFLNELKM